MTTTTEVALLAPASAAHAEAYLAPITRFVEAIGLGVERGEVPADAFLPGILVVQHGLRVDPRGRLHVGDLLHEAGHLAGMSAAERAQPLPAVSTDGGLEMMAIAWSYAAACAIGVPLEVLFHPSGYKGGAANLISNFAAGRYIGVPMLQYFGMAYEPRLAAMRGVRPYPHMVRWLRE